MRKSSWTPSIVPSDDQNVYLVVDDFGQFGRVWREADIEKTDLESVIQDLLEGQYNNPIGVFGINPAEGWSRRSPPTLPRSRAGDATCRCAASPEAFEILSNATKAAAVN
jgi:hypothetical protein